ncbi:hypothetical protein AAKU55_005886 [Oxalobacteraceae bacterium GrIS 1.11]
MIIRLAFLFLIVSLSSKIFAKDQIHPDFCKEIPHKSGYQALLVDENNDHIQKNINFGIIDIEKEKKKDFIFSNTKYRLVLFPKKLEIKDDCSMSFCIEKTKTQSKCNSTSEYILSMGVNPHKYQPGKFESEISFQIEDPTSDYPKDIEVNFAFQQKIIGEFSMSWIEIERTNKLNKTSNEIFEKNEITTTINLKNTGDRSTMLGAWESTSKSLKTFTIQPDGCANKLLKPKDTCAMTIKKNVPFTNDEKYYSWVNITGEDAALEIYFEKHDDGKVSYGIQNK